MIKMVAGLHMVDDVEIPKPMIELMHRIAEMIRGKEGVKEIKVDSTGKHNLAVGPTDLKETARVLGNWCGNVARRAGKPVMATVQNNGALDVVFRPVPEDEPGPDPELEKMKAELDEVCEVVAELRQERDMAAEALKSLAKDAGKDVRKKAEKALAKAEKLLEDGEKHAKKLAEQYEAGGGEL